LREALDASSSSSKSWSALEVADAIRWSVAIFDPARNEPSERLIGVISPKIDKCGPEWAASDGDDETTHLGVFAYVMNGFRVLDHRQLVRTCCNQAKQQAENREQGTHVRAEYGSNFDRLAACKNLLFCRLHHLHFPAFP
jgi:hypothetical protein